MLLRQIKFPISSQHNYILLVALHSHYQYQLKHQMQEHETFIGLFCGQSEAECDVLYLEQTFRMYFISK